MSTGAVPFSTSPGDYGMGKTSGPRPGVLAFIRLLQLVTAFLAFVITASNDHNGYSFKEWHGYNYIVAATFLTLVYSFVMTIYQAIKACSSNKYWGRGMLFAQVVIDFILLLLLWGAASGGAVQSSQNSRRMFAPWGQDGSYVKHFSPPFCKQLHNSGFKDRFCVQAQTGVAFTFLTSFLVIASFWMVTGAHLKGY